MQWLANELYVTYDDSDDDEQYVMARDIRRILLAAQGLRSYEVTASGTTRVEVQARNAAEAKTKAREQLGTAWTVAEVSEQPTT